MKKIMKKVFGIIGLILIFLLFFNGEYAFKRKASGTLWNNWSKDSLCYVWQITGLDSISSMELPLRHGYDGLTTIHIMADSLGNSHDTITISNGRKSTTLYTQGYDACGLTFKYKRYLGKKFGWEEHQLRLYQYSSRATYIDTLAFSNLGTEYVTTLRPDSLNSWFSDVPVPWAIEVENTVDDDSTQTFKLYIEFEEHTPYK